MIVTTLHNKHNKNMIYKIYAIQKGVRVSKSFAFTNKQAQKIAKEKSEVYKNDYPTTILITKN